MDWKAVEADWAAFLPAIGQRWPEADETELIALDGNHAQFVQYLARITATTEEDAAEQIEAWLITNMPSDVRMSEFRDNANIHDSIRSIPPGEDVYSDDGRFGSGDWNDEGPVNPLGNTT